MLQLAAFTAQHKVERARQAEQLAERLEKRCEQVRNAQARLTAHGSLLSGNGGAGWNQAPTPVSKFSREELGKMDPVQRSVYLNCLDADELVRLQ